MKKEGSINILKKIRAIRKGQDWNQQEMANKLGVDLMTYNRLENGATKLTWEYLEQIAEIFKLPVIDVIRYNLDTLKSDEHNEIYNTSKALKNCKEKIINLEKENTELLQEIRLLNKRLLNQEKK